MALHIADGTDDNIRVIPDDTADGATADADRTYTTTDSTDVQSIVNDGTHIHITNWQQSTVRVYVTNTANGGAAGVIRAYTVTGISQPSGMAFDGTHLHISDRNDDNIRVIAPDTADGGTATILRTYTVPGLGDCRGMMFDGENIHAADYTDDNIRVFAPDTADGTDATVLRTYTVPGVNHSRSIAFDGVFVHVSDVNDDNFRVVAVPTADGAQTVLRTYTVRGVDNPRGMTSVADVKITPTITFANTDLVPNQQTLATITFPQDVNGFTRADLTLDVGTLGASLITVSTTVYRISVTAPSSGSGTMTLSIAEDAVMPENNTVSASIDYAEPPVATTLEIVSGDNQSATVSTALANPLVVQVLDQNGGVFSGSTVTFATTGGTLSETSVVTDANGQASTALTLPATAGDYTVTASVSGLTDVMFSATASVSSIVIEAIGEQFITIDTIYSLPISITGDPAEAWAAGLQEGFHQDWDAAAGILTIAGEATRLLSNALWVVYAKETAGSAAVTQDIKYNVVPATPIITEIGALIIYKGQEINFFIPLQNKITKQSVDGLLLGLKSEYEITPGEEDDEDIEGIRVTGELPSGNVLSLNAGDLGVDASNDAGMDTYNLPYTVSSDTPPAMSAVTPVFSDTETTFSWTAVMNATSYAYRIGGEDGKWVDIGNVTSISLSIEDAPDVSLTEWRVNSPWIGDAVPVRTSNIYGLGASDLFKLNAGGAVIWEYTLVNPTGGYLKHALDPSENTYLFNQTDRILYKVNAAGGLVWTYTAVEGTYNQPLVVDASGNAYLFNSTNRTFYKISAAGELAWSYTHAEWRSSWQFRHFDVSASGELYVHYRSNITFQTPQGVSIFYKLDTAGALAWRIFPMDQVATPQPFLLDSSGNIFIFYSGNRRLFKYSSAGTQTWLAALGAEIVASTQFDMGLDDAGNIYIMDQATGTTRNGYIYKVSSAGSYDSAYQAGISGLYSAFVVDADGNRYYSNNLPSSPLFYKISTTDTLVWTHTATQSGDYFDADIGILGDIYLRDSNPSPTLTTRGSIRKFLDSDGSLAWNVGRDSVRFIQVSK